MIICVVGKNKSGKSKVGEWIQEYTKYPLVEVSTLVKKFAESNVRKDLQLEKLKHKDDSDWLYREIKNAIGFTDAASENCIVSGMREYYLLERLEQDFGKTNLMVIAAVIDDEARKERVNALKEKIEDFEADEGRDKELFDMDCLIERADVTIDTTAPAEETKEGIVTLFNQ